MNYDGNDNFNKNEYNSDYSDYTAQRQVMAGVRVKPKSTWTVKKISALALSGVMVGGFSFGAGLSVGKLSKPDLTEPLLSEITQTIPELSSITELEKEYARLSYGVTDNEVVSVIKNVENSVVSINLTAEARDWFNRRYEYPGAGSGVIFKEDNDNLYIVTNNHVIADAVSVSISIDDTAQIAASYVGNDPKSDLAVISVSKSDLIAAGVSNYSIASFGSADDLEVGETVIAIGNAYGEGKTATLGILSAKNKQITTNDGTTLDVIQTDAAINPGNSGGALVNLKGQVIGLNTAKLSASDAEGMGFAIPAESVKELSTEIMENGSVERPYIGIAGSDITQDMQEVYSLPSMGVYVAQVSTIDGQPVSDLRTGDIITAFDGKAVNSMEELQDYIASCAIGDIIQVSIYRENQLLNVPVTIRNYNKDANF